MYFRFFTVLLVPVFFTFAPERGSAQDLFGLCENADDRCRALAVAVEAERLSSGINGARTKLDPGQLLCGPDKPNCCPPELMPVCTATADLVLNMTVRTLATVAMKEICPFDQNVCDQFGSLICGPEQSWNPWAGCNDPVVIIEPEPPTICPPGQRQGGKPGTCVPIPCFHPFLHVEVPCGPDSPQIAARDFEIPDPSDASASGATAVLLRLLADDKVASEARQAVAQANGPELDRLRRSMSPFME